MRRPRQRPVPTPTGLMLGMLIVMPDDVPPGVYAKSELDPAEAEVFVVGPGARVIDVAGRAVGLALCLEANEPHHAAATRALGAAVYAVGALFPHGSETRRAADLAARARETGMWVIGAQPSGRSGSYDTAGTSGIWAPDGSEATRLGSEAPALALAEVP